MIAVKSLEVLKFTKLKTQLNFIITHSIKKISEMLPKITYVSSAGLDSDNNTAISTTSLHKDETTGWKYSCCIVCN